MHVVLFDDKTCVVKSTQNMSNRYKLGFHTNCFLSAQTKEDVVTKVIEVSFSSQTTLHTSSLSFARKSVGKNGRKNAKQHERASVICEAASRV